MRSLILAFLVVSFALMGTGFASDYEFVTESLPPFNDDEGGKPTGAMTDVVYALCRSLKKSCSITVLPWRRALQLAEDGEVSGIFSIPNIPERREKFFVLSPISRTGYAFFIPQDGTWSYSGPNSLEDRTVCVYGPSGVSVFAEQAVTEAHAGRVEIEISNETLILKMANGRYDESAVGLINQDVGRHMMQKMGITTLKFVGEGKSLEYTIGLSRKRTTEAEFKIFDDALHKLKASGAITKLLAPYGLRMAEWTAD